MCSDLRLLLCPIPDPKNEAGNRGGLYEEEIDEKVSETAENDTERRSRRHGPEERFEETEGIFLIISATTVDYLRPIRVAFCPSALERVRAEFRTESESLGRSEVVSLASVSSGAAQHSPSEHLETYRKASDVGKHTSPRRLRAALRALILILICLKGSTWRS